MKQAAMPSCLEGEDNGINVAYGINLLARITGKEVKRVGLTTIRTSFVL